MGADPAGSSNRPVWVVFAVRRELSADNAAKRCWAAYPAGSDAALSAVVSTTRGRAPSVVSCWAWAKACPYAAISATEFAAPLAVATWDR